MESAELKVKVEEDKYRGMLGLGPKGAARKKKNWKEKVEAGWQRAQCCSACCKLKVDFFFFFC